MSCRYETIDGAARRYCPDPPPPAAARLRAVLRGRFIDELTGRGLRADLSLRSEHPALATRVAADGIAGLVGTPTRQLPDLSATSVEVAMQVQAAGYLRRRVAATLGPFNTGAGLPADWPELFRAADLGDVPMHRSGVLLRGRVMRNDLVPAQPIAGATVGIGRFWRRFPAVHEDAELFAEPGALLALRPGLYRDRPAALATVSAVQLIDAVGETKRLTAPARAGMAVLRLSDRLNLAVGDLLGIDVAHPDLAESIPIAGLTGASTPDQPAVVQLAHPLALSHGAGVVAVRRQLQPGVPAANVIRHAAIPGDRILFADALLGMGPAAVVVEIAGGPMTTELQIAVPYQVQTDTDGYYRLPLLSRVAQLELEADGGGLPQAVTRLVSPAYDLIENRFDLVFN